MNPSFHICQEDGCSITITGLSYDDGLYLKETDIIQPYNKFKYSDTVTINVIQLNTVDDVILLDNFIVSHCSYLDEVHYKLQKDGYYMISHIVLPTKKAIERIIENDDTFVDQYDYIYAEDNGLIVKFKDNKWIESSVEEIVEINNCNTTISKANKELFSMCRLWGCYVDICRNLLSSNLNKCKKNPELEDLIFNRDVIWMTINVLNYLVERNQLYEAERLLEEVKGCNGFCQESRKIIKSGGCGCGR